ncbi:thiamine ABC transporter permease [Vibrio sp. ZSDE26]|uniref:Thiamine ABC transporter permease n=1 Tax=Vibrio amylolyticus TaxID=2847292 RepID=A0A9X1XH68_9VIBR|nr:thiamine ABC transporter permease [Vibrio amylolyticus]MCK6262904.1 thiamine ABC transporter permease [Vibrio amylolyticus]
MLRALYPFIILICFAPTIPGIVGLLSSSLGYLPAINMHTLSWDGFNLVFEWHGVWQSIGLSLFSSMFSSYVALLLTFGILLSCWGSRHWNKVELALSPLLALPHVAFAIGFAFLFAPTGLLSRTLFSAFGYNANHQSVNDLPILINDPYALGLVVMLVLKEIPFLLLMSMAILKQLNIQKIEKVASSLGYNRTQMWWKVVFPQWLNKMRFPILAVIAYSLSVVDIALIIGPTNPPTFAVLVWQWFSEPELTLLPRAAAGAMVLFLLASLLMVTARLIEWLLIQGMRSWQVSGRYGRAIAGRATLASVIFVSIIIFPLMMVWSFAQRWRFPDLIPSQFTIRYWQYEWSALFSNIQHSLSLAIASASIALILAIVAHEYRLKHRWALPDYLIALPMLLPQLSILFGIQVATLYINQSSYYLWTLWAHVFFAFPFVYLALDGPWRSYDMNLTKSALSLGKSPLLVWWKIKMPILSLSIAFAWAIGASVSLAQYLPTLMLGGGRISTITTEAVALSSGFDRRVTAIYALWQAILPLLIFSFAIAIGRLNLRSRQLSIKGLITNESLPQKPFHSQP